MRSYYETAPLPGPLAWLAHSLPAWFHRWESWATLGFELLVPCFCFGPKRPRLLALAGLSLFQVFNLVTANYGFFSYLSLALHVVLLDDSELRALGAAWPWLSRWSKLARGTATFAPFAALRVASAWLVRRIAFTCKPQAWPRASRTLVLGVCSFYLLVSCQQGVQRFVNPRARVPGLDLLFERVAHLRVINTYHLFAQITLERIEPTFAVRAGDQWTELAFHYKPGPVERASPLVAPHQPRVDFLLWFYGLRFRGAPPNYVKALLSRLCYEPSAGAELFTQPPPQRPDQVHLDFWQYHLTDPAERAATGKLWKRTELAGGQSLDCAARRPAR